MSEAEASSEGAKPSAVAIKANIAARLNVAFHQNSVPAIAEIELVNDTDVDLNGVAISISAEPSFLQPKTFRVDYIRVCTTGPKLRAQRSKSPFADQRIRLQDRHLPRPCSAIRGLSGTGRRL
jgi:hypothetical protein